MTAKVTNTLATLRLVDTTHVEVTTILKERLRMIIGEEFAHFRKAFSGIIGSSYPAECPGTR